MSRAVLFLSLILVAAVAPAAHAGCPWTEDYSGPFQVALDSTAITLFEADGKTVKCVAPIDKELLGLVGSTADTIHCVLTWGFSTDPARSDTLWVSHLYVNIGGKTIPVSVGGSILFGGKNLVLTVVTPSLVRDE